MLRTRMDIKESNFLSSAESISPLIKNSIDRKWIIDNWIKVLIQKVEILIIL